MIRHTSILTLVLLLAAFSPLCSQTLTVESGQMSFTGSVPLHDFTGESDSLSGQINLSEKKFRFSLPLRSLDTGIGRRDRKMYEILNTDEYPEVVFEGVIAERPETTFRDTQRVTVEGELSLNGQTKPESINGIVIREENGIRIEASFPFDYTKYGIERPGFLFYKVHEEIEVRIQAFLR
jgi:polyisoprenoid-binding protein YceI